MPLHLQICIWSLSAPKSAAAAAAVTGSFGPDDMNWNAFIKAVDLLLPDQQAIMDEQQGNKQQDGGGAALMPKTRALPVLIAADPTIADLVESRREELLAFM